MEKAVAEGLAPCRGGLHHRGERRRGGPASGRAHGANLVVVGHSVGFKGPNIDEFLPEHYQEITSLGGKVLKATILTHSLDTARRRPVQRERPHPAHRQHPAAPGAGAQGLLRDRHGGGGRRAWFRKEKKCVAIGGTARGWDTVAIVRSAASKRFLQLSVLEIWAKPRV